MWFGIQYSVISRQYSVFSRQEGRSAGQGREREMRCSLPAALEREFLQALHTYEKAQQMPYITSIERIGIQKGIEQGIRQGEATLLLRLIALKFGEADEDAIGQIRAADTDTLLRWSERILTAETLADLLK